MKKSARQLGYMIGKTAQDVNKLLKDNGYLEGVPGNYELTEKGKKYAEEKYHSNGIGGYSQYQVSYTTRKWDEEVAYEIGDPDACQRSKEK